MKRLNEWLPWLLVGLAVIACYLPWAWHPTAGLSLNDYDLAEWASLHPQARASTPPLLTPFLLRAVFALLSVFVALAAAEVENRAARRALWLGALVLAVTLFPPLEFFTEAWGDPNYRQQFALGIGAGIAVLALALGSTRLPENLRRASAGLAALLAAGSGIGGLLQAADLIRVLGVAFMPGGGIFLLVGTLAPLAAANLYGALKN